MPACSWPAVLAENTVVRQVKAFRGARSRRRDATQTLHFAVVLGDPASQMQRSNGNTAPGLVFWAIRVLSPWQVVCNTGRHERTEGVAHDGMRGRFMSPDRPSILVTGASGFVGRNFLAANRDDFRIFALARRSQREVGVEPHPNITWVQVDITDWPRLKAVMRRVKQLGGVDGVLHLAAFYDFTNRDRAEYLLTNVNGTRHMLEMAKWLCVGRFVFASSTAACRFPPPGSAVSERSPPDANFPYARSKADGEALTREYSRWFPCSIVRFPAVFSDWCEYRPLYEFLNTWCSHRWNARILAGRGGSAVSYVHVVDLVRLLTTVFVRSHALPGLDVYVASPNGATSHRDLFGAATRGFFGIQRRPLLAPRALVAPGLVCRRAVGSLTGRAPFERWWMLAYVDRKLVVDSSYTQKALGWAPSDRLQVLRRTLNIVANLKRDPARWHLRNRVDAARETERVHLVISGLLEGIDVRVLDRVMDRLQRLPTGVRQRPLRTAAEGELRRYVEGLVATLVAAVRSGDREFLLPHVEKIVRAPYAWGCRPEDVRELFEVVEEAAIEELMALPGAAGREPMIHDCVAVTLRLAADEIDDSYRRFVAAERLPARPTFEPAAASSLSADLERLASQLNAFYEVENDGFDPQRPTAGPGLSSADRRPEVRRP